MRRIKQLVVAGCLCLTACGPRDARKEAVTGDSGSGQGAATDTAWEGRTLALLRTDSALAGTALASTLALLQAQTDTAAAEVTAAPALLRLGWLKLRLFEESVPDSFVVRRPDDFAYDEVSASHLYQGREFAELLQRYPGSVLADDAAYAETLLPLGGECEGFIECYVRAATYRAQQFLRDFPDSPHAAGVIKATTDELSDIFAQPDHHVLFETNDLTIATPYHDPAAVQRELESYETAVRRVAPDRAAPSLFLLAGLWEQFRRPAAAVALYETLLNHPGSVPLDSVRLRLARLR